MSDGMKLIMSKNGTFKEYDDTYDIVIHCESKEEHDRIIEKFNTMSWIPADHSPKSEEYVLLSFENFSTPLVGMYREDSDGGAYYVGDDEESCISHYIVVNAWMPLPAPYRPNKCHGCHGASNNDCERCGNNVPEWKDRMMQHFVRGE